MQARVRTGFIPSRFVLIGIALMVSTLNFPASGYAGTYADLENCLNSNTADGCYNYTLTSKDNDGNTVYTVYQRCGHAVARVKTYRRKIDAGEPIDCGAYLRNAPWACGAHCLNGGGTGGLVYNEYQFQDAFTTYCDGTSETITVDERVANPEFWSLFFGTLPNCLVSDQTYACQDKLLCTIIIDPCEGSKDPCCRDKCCGNQCCGGGASSGGAGGGGGGGNGSGNNGDAYAGDS